MLKGFVCAVLAGAFTCIPAAAATTVTGTGPANPTSMISFRGFPSGGPGNPVTLLSFDVTPTVDGFVAVEVNGNMNWAWSASVVANQSYSFTPNVVVGQNPYGYFQFDVRMRTGNASTPGSTDAKALFGSYSYLLGDNLTPVPEPATWALMLLGFGLAGIAARNRSLSVAKRTSSEQAV